MPGDLHSSRAKTTRVGTMKWGLATGRSGSGSLSQGIPRHWEAACSLKISESSGSPGAYDCGGDLEGGMGPLRRRRLGPTLPARHAAAMRLISRTWGQATNHRDLSGPRHRLQHNVRCIREPTGRD